MKRERMHTHKKKRIKRNRAKNHRQTAQKRCERNGKMPTRRKRADEIENNHKMRCDRDVENKGALLHEHE